MKTCEEMTNDVLARVHAYEAEQQQKHAKMKRIAVSAIPVCAAAAVGFGLWQGGIRPQEPQRSSTAENSQPEMTDESAAAATEVQSAGQTEETVNTERTAQTTETQSASQTKQTESGNEANPPAVTVKTNQNSSAVQNTETTSAQNGSEKAPSNGERIVFSPDNGSEIPDSSIIQTITTYPLSGDFDYPPAEYGKVVVTVPVSRAMAEYGDTVTYSVRVDVFSGNGTKQVVSRGALYAEAERLAKLGYTAALEGVSSDWGKTFDYNLSVLFASKKQVESFPASEQYGYFLRLYASDSDGSCIEAYNPPAVFYGDIQNE